MNAVGNVEGEGKGGRDHGGYEATMMFVGCANGCRDARDMEAMKQMEDFITSLALRKPGLSSSQLTKSL